jgi:hypothetical protein
MGEEVQPTAIKPQVEFVVTFKRSDLLGTDRHLYLVKGFEGPPPYSACCNICPYDEEAKAWGEPEVFGVDSGGINEAFKKAEVVLTARHAGHDKRITFDFMKSW